MNQFQPVLWNKGAFLQPQHLQYQDAYLHTLLKFRIDSLIPFAYGFRSVTIDPERLENGHLSLSTASGILPDGLAFDVPFSDLEPDPRSLVDAFPEGQTSLDVKLAVPHLRYGGLKISFVPRRNANTRFVADSLDLRDEGTGLDPKPVQIARKNLRLLLPHDQQDGFSTMTAARVVRKGDRFELDPAFVPPLLHISASPHLTGLLRDITAVLNARSHEIAQTRRSRNESIADYSASETANFWLLYTVNACIPIFRHLLNAPHVHPSRLYLEMSSLASVLTGFELKISSNDLPDYDHDNLTDCFHSLDTQLRQLLEAPVRRFHVSIPLLPTDQPYVYAASIPDDRLFVDGRFFLAISCDMRPEKLQQVAPNLIKIASTGRIQTIINSAVAGVPISNPGSLPRTIPIRAGYQLFKLDTSGDYWQAIKQGRSLAVFVPSAIVKPSMELIVLLTK
jgi:type VI secretion system protein ImpJ